MVRVFIFIMAACAMASAAQAQRPAPEGWRLTAGGAVFAAPFYEGAEEYRVLPVPYLAVEYGDRFSASFENGLRYDVAESETYQFGVGADFDFGRDANDAAILGGLEEVDTSLGPQIYGRYTSGPFLLRGRAFVDLADGHGGATADLSVGYRALSGFKTGFLTLTAGTQIADASYVSSLFGVSEADAANSLAGLPAYDAGAGITRYTAGALYLRPLTRKAQITVLANVSQLTGDAADSPIVQNETQGFGLAALTYTF